MLELVDHGVHDPDCTGKQEKAAAAQEKKGISELFNLDFLCPSFWASLRTSGLFLWSAKLSSETGVIVA